MTGPLLAGRRPFAAILDRLPELERHTTAVSSRLDRIRGLLSVAIAAFLLILNWPVETVVPGIGLDASWVAALHVAAQRHLHFGSELAYTFGPLGFLGLPGPYFGWTSVLAFAFVVGVAFVAVTAIVWLLRRAFPFWIAIPLAYLITKPISWIAGWNLLAVLTFIAGVELLRRYGPRNIPGWALAGLGVVAGLSLLGKLNVGINVVMIGGLISLLATTRRRPAVLIFGLAAAGSFLVAWVALGQVVWDIPAYARYSLDISMGYNQAMGMDFGPNTDWIYLLGIVVLATVTLVAFETTTDWSRSQRLGLMAIGLVTAFLLFKTGFVRNNFGPFYASVLMLLPAFALRAARGRFALSVATLVVALLVGTGGSLGAYLDPAPGIANARAQVSMLTFHRANLASSTQVQMQNLYAIPPEAAAAIGDHTVQVEPFDAGVAFAYPGLRWDPLPVFQTYSAYTPFLDEADAAALRASSAPERILWLTPPGGDLSVDGRSAFLDAPETMIEMICRYEPVAASPSWQVLARVPDRCGTPELLGTSTASAGRPVQIPLESRPGRLIVVHVRGVASSWTEKITGLVFKTPEWWMRTKYGATRLVPENASGPLLIGWTGSSDYVERLAFLGPPPEVTVGTQVNGGVPVNESADPLTYDFYSIPISHVSP